MVWVLQALNQDIVVSHHHDPPPLFSALPSHHQQHRSTCPHLIIQLRLQPLCRTLCALLGRQCIRQLQSNLPCLCTRIGRRCDKHTSNVEESGWHAVKGSSPLERRVMQTCCCHLAASSSRITQCAHACLITCACICLLLFQCGVLPLERDELLLLRRHARLGSSSGRITRQRRRGHTGRGRIAG